MANSDATRSANPWNALLWRPPYVLSQDAAGARPYSTDLPPGPWYGPLATARVVILMLMPGEHEQDYLDIRDDEFMAMSRGQLSATAPFPWHLERWRSTGGGTYWWPRLRHLVRDTSEEAMAEGLAIAQLHPYHSPEWASPTGPIPSQAYTVALVRKAIDRGAIFPAMVGWSRWLALVPELARAQVVSGRSQRTTHLSPRNLGPTAYGRVRDRLMGSET